MNEYNSISTKLLTGTVVYFIASFLSKGMQFLMVPILTGLLLPEEFGYYDIVISTWSLLFPLITFQIIDGLFRYLYKSDDEYATKLISNVSYVLTISVVILISLVSILSILTNKIQYPGLICLYYICNIIFMMFQKIARSKEFNNVFAISGILYTLILLLLQALFLIVFSMRIDGLFVANSLACVVGIIYISFNVGCLKYFTIRKPDFNLIREVILYSAPLIPSSLSWWGITSINSYMIIMFIGVEYNGIYAIASKFPGLLVIATSVFQLSWQESAITEMENNKNSLFYTKIFSVYMKLVLSFVAVAIVVTKIIIPYFLNENFISAWKYIPILYYTSVFSSFSAFMGAGYLASKKTAAAFKTTIYGGLLNVIITLMFIGKLGLFAPAFGSMLGFVLLMIVRVNSLKKTFYVEINWMTFALLTVFGVLSCTVYYLFSGIYLVVSCVVFVFSFILINKVEIKKIFKKTFNKKHYS